MRAAPPRICRSLVLGACGSAALGAGLSGLLVGVTDGDAIEVLLERGSYRVAGDMHTWHSIRGRKGVDADVTAAPANTG